MNPEPATKKGLIFNSRFMASGLSFSSSICLSLISCHLLLICSAIDAVLGRQGRTSVISTTTTSVPGNIENDPHACPTPTPLLPSPPYPFIIHDNGDLHAYPAAGRHLKKPSDSAQISHSPRCWLHALCITLNNAETARA